jgi:glycosyltransferase involved in cell wall biosynthesis
MIINFAFPTKNPLVSVVIPSYNRADSVGETIESIIFQQCNFDFEIIIGDDCSKDNTREVLLNYQQQFPGQIKLIFHEQNIGLGANWATCVKECLGKYICNCDNDDYWHNPNKLQLQVDFMESHPSENVVITNHRCHHRDTGVINEEKAWIDRSMPLQQAFFHGHERFCNATVMYRKDFLFNHVNLDDYIKHQFTLQDWNTWMILSAYTDFYIMPISTATFGMETESITRPKTYESIINRFTKEKECYKYVCDLFPIECPFDENGWNSYVNRLLLSLAYKKYDFKSAKIFGSLLLSTNNINLKIKCSTNALMFYGYCMALKIKSKIVNK